MESCDVPECYDEIELVGGMIDWWMRAGRLMVKHNGLWGYVCNQDWNWNDAKVVCRRWNMKPLDIENIWKIDADDDVSNAFLKGSGHGIHMNGLKCEGDESNLAMCKHSGYGNHNCDYSQIVGVTCESENWRG